MSSLCLSIGPLGTCLICRFSPAGFNMLADLYMACRFHGWWVYKLENHLAASTKAVALKCRKLCSQGTCGHVPGYIRLPQPEEGVLLAPVGEAKVMLNIPQCTWQPPTQGHPACNSAKAEPSRTQQSYPRYVCPREMKCVSTKQTGNHICSSFINKSPTCKQSNVP